MGKKVGAMKILLQSLLVLGVLLQGILSLPVTDQWQEISGDQTYTQATDDDDVASSPERIGEGTLQDQSATQFDDTASAGTKLVRYPHATKKKANDLVLYIEC